MFCRNCGRTVADPTRACAICGALPGQGRIFCQTCGELTPLTATVCAECGARLSVERVRVTDLLRAGQDQQKDGTTALLLCILPAVFGIHGLHRLYTGHIVTGILQLITVGCCFVWTLIDVFLILTGSFRDSAGRPLTKT